LGKSRGGTIKFPILGVIKCFAMPGSFEEKVLRIVSRIPRGRVTTYGIIASAAGMPSSARTVGWILNRHKFERGLPFHRVVNREGVLTGKMHFETPDLMAQLLKSEGVPVIGDKIPGFEKYLWVPGEEEMENED